MTGLGSTLGCRAGRLALAAALFSISACATGPKPVPVTPFAGAHAPATTNPFEGAEFYGPTEFGERLEKLAAANPAQAEALRKVGKQPVAFWLDNIEHAKNTSKWLDEAAKAKTASGKPPLTVFVVYDLPGRDCNAAASAGELDVKSGEGRYQQQYIDMIAAAFKAHPSQPIVAILEPDSLANLATNMENPNCAAAAPIYKRGIAYAISKLSAPNVHMYLDAAHVGWLGWPKNLTKIGPIFKEVLDMAGGPDLIRGFALNVSNYDPPKGTYERKQPNEPAPDELGYAKDLSDALAKVGITGKGFIIDTSRNGKADIRSTPGNWCNIRGAGLGERPQASPAPLIDAYYWVKTPGQSDGISDKNAKRFDENCISDDAVPGAPEAGEWFDSYLLDLVKNANPPL